MGSWVRRIAVSMLLLVAGASALAQSRLSANQVLAPGASLSSPQGGYALRLNASGNLVYLRNGASEVWAINPGYATSTIKLLDQPMPDSLKPATRSGC